MITLYLPTKLLELYMNLCTNYYLQFLKDKSTPFVCRMRNERGLLCCDKNIRSNYGKFCSWSHANCKCNLVVSLSEFVGSDYGDDYMDLRTGDHIQLIETRTDAEGWSYGRNLRSNKIGWFPPSYVEARK